MKNTAERLAQAIHDKQMADIERALPAPTVEQGKRRAEVARQIARDELLAFHAEQREKQRRKSKPALLSELEGEIARLNWQLWEAIDLLKRQFHGFTASERRTWEDAASALVATAEEDSETVLARNPAMVANALHEDFHEQTRQAELESEIDGKVRVRRTERSLSDGSKVYGVAIMDGTALIELDAIDERCAEALRAQLIFAISLNSNSQLE